MATYTDEEIQALLKEPKPLSKEYESLYAPRPGPFEKIKVSKLDVKAESGNEYRLIVRQSSANPLYFSVILGIFPKGSGSLFRLRRYNGPHEHGNPLEGQVLDGFHVHTATERYQREAFPPDKYAEPSDRYASVSEAIDCMIADCGFVLPDDTQAKLF